MKISLRRPLLKHRATNERLHILALVSFFISLLVSLYFTIAYPHWHDDTSVFNVQIRTEQIEVSTTGGGSPIWYMSDADVRFPCPDESAQMCDTDGEGELFYRIPEFTGAVELRGKVKITMTRVGSSEFTVTISQMHDEENSGPDSGEQVVAELYDAEDEFLASATGYAIISFHDMGKRYDEGESIYLNISGVIDSVDTTDYPDSNTRPVLLEGDVSILEQAVPIPLIRENYIIGPFELGLGDSVRMINPYGKAEGFVRVDDEPGFRAVYRSEAEKALITRYRFDGYHLSAGIWNRLLHDELLSILWALTITIFSVVLTTIGMDSKKDTSA